MRFTNEAVKKEFSKIKNYLWIGVLLIILSFVFLSLGDKRDSMDKKDALNMHNLIVDNLKDKTGKMGFINANNIPYKFAVYKDTTDAYYFVTDDKYIYFAYMDSDTFNGLNNKKIEKKAKKIIGITKETPDDIKKLAVSSYNEIVGNQNKITIDDYNDYFGSIYLDMTSSNSGFYYLMFIAFLLIGFILLIIYVASNRKFKKGMKKLSDEELKEIDDELNSKDSFYYENAHLVLTKNYVVNLGASFSIIKYSDIIWLYPYVLRTRGVKSSESIIAVTNDAKRHSIANISMITKAKKEAFNEIFDTIASRNPDILVGYNRDTCDRANVLIKEIKQKKKNSK